MKVYKLTDKNDQTLGGTQWSKGVSHTAIEAGNELCSEQVIHCYRDPLLAVLFNPIHANFSKPHLWEAETDEIVADDGLKLGVKKLTTLKRIRIPRISKSQYIAFAILCALEVRHDEAFAEWAEGWLSGKDRTRIAAGAVVEAAEAATWAAAEVAKKKIDFVSIAHKAMEYTVIRRRNDE